MKQIVNLIVVILILFSWVDYGYADPCPYNLSESLYDDPGGEFVGTFTNYNDAENAVHGAYVMYHVIHWGITPNLPEGYGSVSKQIYVRGDGWHFVWAAYNGECPPVPDTDGDGIPDKDDLKFIQTKDKGFGESSGLPKSPCN